MFGYVRVDKMELKFKEYYSYRGYYCGLCMCLKNMYGNISRLTLNYDMTFLILLLSSLYEFDNKAYNSRCMVHPAKKHLVLQNEVTEYAAALNVILSYYNLIDDWEDERNIKSLALAGILKRPFIKSSFNLQDKSEKIKLHLKNISLLEKQNAQGIDEVANEFGHIMEEIVAYRKDFWEKSLRRTGFYLGKYIYYSDAYEDMEKDKKNNSYNPFNNAPVDDKNKYARDILMLNLSFLSNEIEKLPLVRDKGIIDNILYSGMPGKLITTDDEKENNK